MTTLIILDSGKEHNSVVLIEYDDVEVRCRTYQSVVHIQEDCQQKDRRTFGNTGRAEGVKQ